MWTIIQCRDYDAGIVTLGPRQVVCFKASALQSEAYQSGPTNGATDNFIDELKPNVLEPPVASNK